MKFVSRLHSSIKCSAVAKTKTVLFFKNLLKKISMLKKKVSIFSEGKITIYKELRKIRIILKLLNKNKGLRIFHVLIIKIQNMKKQVEYFNSEWNRT